MADTKRRTTCMENPPMIDGNRWKAPGTYRAGEFSVDSRVSRDFQTLSRVQKLAHSFTSEYFSVLGKASVFPTSIYRVLIWPSVSLLFINLPCVDLVCVQ